MVQTLKNRLCSDTMSNTQLVRAALQQKLAAAAEDIFILFEQTLRDYEQQLFLWKQRTEHQQHQHQQHQHQQQHQQRAPSRCQGPVQLSEQDVDVPSKKATDVGEDDEEALHVKEEQEDEGWATAADEKQEEADIKETMFNIVHVQRSDDDGRQLPRQSQEVEKEGGALPSSSTEQLSGTPPLSGAKTPQQGEEQRERPYTCSTCNKSFRMKSILTRHMKTHTGEKPYGCSVCGRSFIQRSYLHTHMNSHSGQKPHTCRFCGRGFTQVGNMNAHMRIHTGEKPHRCSDCGKSFREKADLIKHAIIHTGEKPYSCSVCNVRFSAQSNLTRHMKTHSGEKPYRCAACGKRFVRRSHLLVHMKTHAGENT